MRNQYALWLPTDILRTNKTPCISTWMCIIHVSTRVWETPSVLYVPDLSIQHAWSSIHPSVDEGRAMYPGKLLRWRRGIGCDAYEEEDA